MNVDVALRMLLHDRGKLALTIVGVAFSVTLVFVQLGLFRGLLGNATVTIEHADADLWITSKNTPNVDFPHFFSESHVDRVRSVPGVLRADNLMVAFVAMQLPNGAEENVVVYGLENPSAWHLPWAVTEGTADAIRRGRTMLLDESAIRRFGSFRVGDRRELFGRRLDIVGKTKEALSFTTMPMAFTSLSVAQELEPSLFGGRTAYVLVKVAPRANVEAVAAELRKRLPYNDVYTRSAWAERTRNYWVVSTGLGLNMAFTVFLGVLVGVTVVAQTLYAAALDHMREFATLKAMGASSFHVCSLVATQAAVAGLVGFFVAMPFVFVVRTAARSAGLEVVLSLSTSIVIFAGTIALCVAASLLTFRRLATIDPALVFRT